MIQCRNCGRMLKIRPHQRNRRCFACGAITYTNDLYYQQDFWRKLGPYHVIKKEQNYFEYQREFSKGLILACIVLSPLLYFTIRFIIFFLLGIFFIIFYVWAIHAILTRKTFVIDREQRFVEITTENRLIKKFRKSQRILFKAIKSIRLVDDREDGTGVNSTTRFYNIIMNLVNREEVELFSSQQGGLQGREVLFKILNQMIFETGEVDYSVPPSF